MCSRDAAVSPSRYVLGTPNSSIAISTISGASTASITASPTQAPTDNDKPPKKPANAGAIAGGITCGIATLLLLVGVFLYRRRRAHSKLVPADEFYTPRHVTVLAEFTEAAPSSMRSLAMTSTKGGHEPASLPGIEIGPPSHASSAQSHEAPSSLPPLPGGSQQPADADPNILLTLENLRDEMRQVRCRAR